MLKAQMKRATTFQKPKDFKEQLRKINEEREREEQKLKELKQT
jgi:hypothetical protein